MAPAIIVFLAARRTSKRVGVCFAVALCDVVARALPQDTWTRRARHAVLD